MSGRIRKEDPVIYFKHKTSTSPSAKNPKNLHPAQRGESYRYDVKKYWRVVVVSRNFFLCKTRTGKLNKIDREDSRIRKANWLERFWFGFVLNRFPRM